MAKMYKVGWYYKILRVYTNYIFKKWFSSVEINGLGYVPDKGSVIFAPNHQNALMDAMALLVSSPSPVVFLARADLFKRKVINFLLRSIKIMPAYRMRDGIQNLKKNDASFDSAVEVLLHDHFFCLMPEGGQDVYRRLRPLVKGMFRIAFAAQEKLPEGESVLIVPTGIDYGNYDRSGHHLVVSFGKPIHVSKYIESFRENAPVAQNRLRDDLAARMSELMLDIRSQKYYDAFYVAAHLGCADLLNETDRDCYDFNETNLLAMRQLIVRDLQKLEETEPDKLVQFAADCAEWKRRHENVEYAARMKMYGCRLDSDVIRSTLYLIVTLPLFLCSLIFNGIPYAIVKLMSLKTKNTGFEASVAFGLSAVLFPLFYIGYAVAFVPMLDGWLLKFCFMLLLPLSFFFMQRFRYRFRYVKERLKNVFVKDELADKIRQFVRNCRS